MIERTCLQFNQCNYFAPKSFTLELFHSRRVEGWGGAFGLSCAWNFATALRVLIIVAGGCLVSCFGWEWESMMGGWWGEHRQQPLPSQLCWVSVGWVLSERKSTTNPQPFKTLFFSWMEKFLLSKLPARCRWHSHTHTHTHVLSKLSLSMH